MRTSRSLSFATALVLGACSLGPNYSYSGTLQAPDAAVGSTIGGRVVRVLVSEGNTVRAGVTLLRFDDAQPRAAVAASSAQLAQARAALADLLAGPRAQDLAHARALAQQQRAQAELARTTRPYQSSVARNQLLGALADEYDARAAAHQARADADRMRSLFATGDVSAQERDAAVAKEAHADAQLVSSIAAVHSARSQAVNTTAVALPQNEASAQAAYQAAQSAYASLAAGARPDQVRQARAAVQAAQGNLALDRARLDETIVRASAGGVVTAMDLHPGDLVAPGASVATIEETGNPYVRIYVSQSDLGRVKLGATLPVRSDATSGTFEGVVEQIDARAQFTPQSVQTESDRAVLSFGVKVRVHDPQQQLHPGTTVEVALP